MLHFMSEQVRICPASNTLCLYQAVCAAASGRIARGARFLSDGFVEENPRETRMLEPITDIIDGQPCSQLAVDGLWNIATSDTEHPDVRERAAELASVIINARADHAGWEEFPS